MTKFADLGYVAGLAPYPYLVLLKDSNPSKIRSQATTSPGSSFEETTELLIWYSDIAEFVLRKGTETLVTNMFGRAIVSNFLSIKKSSGEGYKFTLPVNKNGMRADTFLDGGSPSLFLSALLIISMLGDAMQ